VLSGYPKKKKKESEKSNKGSSSYTPSLELLKIRNVGVATAALYHHFHSAAAG
jgi:hypothetical protein